MTRSEKSKRIRTNLARVRDLLRRAEEQASEGRTANAVYQIETALEYVIAVRHGLLDLSVMIREEYPKGVSGGKRRHGKTAKKRGVGTSVAEINRLLRK